MKMLFVAAMAALLAQAVPAPAAGDTPGATPRSERGQYQAERRARYEEWCKANPEKCREVQARREQCKADPAKCRAERQARVEARFKRADANGDGRLSRDEAQKGMPRLTRHFDQIDANHDGVVTLEELHAARKARLESRRERGI